jgi:Fe2+ transport system protein FeoA
MNCGFCGLEFDPQASRQHCQACLQIAACVSVRCPRCGYEMAEEPAFLQRLLGGGKPGPKIEAPAGVACGNGDASPSFMDVSRHVELLMATDAPNERCLAELAPGEEGVVSRLSSTSADEADIRKLLALGVMPGVPLKVVRRTPSIVFELGFTEFAIDAALARSIMVRV